ncbi:hypothetical protein [Zavarzinia sp. CC-PAN008]|uniref:hypothetical protein n=1 Tax=Zavarzinia sp. CC-PAN008 TaxID=3243332 RepID=UPI003F749F0F
MRPSATFVMLRLWGEKRRAQALVHVLTQMVDHRNPAFMLALLRMKRMPVPITEFLDSPEYLGNGTFEVWPRLREEIIAMNPDVLLGEPHYHEILHGGATGTGKSFLATGNCAYQLYVATCFDEPQRLFNLSPVTPLVMMMQSVSTTVTKRVIYKPFRDLFTGMDYSRRWLRWDKNKDSTFVLEGNIEVAPALANIQAMVGQAIFAAILDEVNFMSVVENSKQVPGAAGLGGYYDQAATVYTNIARRRKSRFTSRGMTFGQINVISSVRYEGDFMERRIAQAQGRGADEEPETGVYVYRRKQYEVQPSDRYKGPTFRVIVGNDRWPTRILRDHEKAGRHYPAEAQVENVPVEYRADFQRDPEGSLRDVIGIATAAITAFIGRRDKIVEANQRWRTAGHKPWSLKPDVDLAVDGMPQIEEDLGLTPAQRRAPRWIHVDLSTVKDRCGIAIVRLDGFMNLVRPATWKRHHTTVGRVSMSGWCNQLHELPHHICGENSWVGH